MFCFYRLRFLLTRLTFSLCFQTDDEESDEEVVEPPRKCPAKVSDKACPIFFCCAWCILLRIPTYFFRSQNIPKFLIASRKLLLGIKALVLIGHGFVALILSFFQEALLIRKGKKKSMTPEQPLPLSPEKLPSKPSGPTFGSIGFWNPRVSTTVVEKGVTRKIWCFRCHRWALVSYPVFSFCICADTIDSQGSLCYNFLNC